METPTAMLLRSLSGVTFRFDPGAICLRFAITGGEGDRAVHETLHTPADLQRWIEATLATRPERATARDLAGAKRLRESIWQLANARADGRRLPPEHVAGVNRAAARPALVPRIDEKGHRSVAAPATASQALSTVAREAVDLLTGPLANRIRRCAGTNCTLVFADTSRPGRRLWCSMERCGNRAKVGAFRNRRRKEETR